MGYCFDMVFRPDVTTQDDVLERLRRAGAAKVVGLFGAVDNRKHRAAMRKGRVGRRQD